MFFANSPKFSESFFADHHSTEDCSVSSLSQSYSLASTSSSDTADITLNFLSLSNPSIIHISAYLQPIERCAVLSKVNWRCNDLFLMRHYCSAMQPLNADLFESDLSYFDKNVSPLLSEDKLSIELNESVLHRNTDGGDDTQLMANIRFFLIHYDSYLKLQNRYNKIHRYQCRSFPAILRSITIQTRFIDLKTVFSMGAIMEYCNAKSPIKQWILRNCDLTDSHLGQLCESMMRRKHFLPITSIDISGNPKITDSEMGRFMNAMGECCPKLLQLNMCQTNISDQSCAIIGEYFIRYIDLNSHYLPNITWVNTKVSRNGESIFTAFIDRAYEPIL